MKLIRMEDLEDADGEYLYPQQPPRKKPPDREIQAECVRGALAAFHKPCTKEVGQLLVFKRGVTSDYVFHEDTVFIIADIFEQPLASGFEAGGTQYGRKLDIAVLAYEVNLGTLWMTVDSRFFEDYIPEANA